MFLLQFGGYMGPGPMGPGGPMIGGPPGPPPPDFQEMEPLRCKTCTLFPPPPGKYMFCKVCIIDPSNAVFSLDDKYDMSGLTVLMGAFQCMN